MTLREAAGETEDEGREVDESLPLPVRGSKNVGRLNFDMGGIAKTAIVSFAVTFVVLSLMAFAGGGSYVTKKDFTTTMENVAATLQKAEAGYAKSQNDIALAIQGIPNTVSVQVNTATSSLRADMASLSTRVTNVGNSAQSNANSISQLATRLDSIIADLTAADQKLIADAIALRAEAVALQARTKALEDDDTLTTKVGALETKIKALEDTTVLKAEISALQTRIKALEDAIVNLGSQSVTVDETVRQYSIANGATVYVPLAVTNNGNTDATVSVKLVLVAPSGITVTSATMSGTYTVSISGSTVTYSTTAPVDAKSTVTFNGIWVVLNYTGTSANTWSAVWSKQ